MKRSVILIVLIMTLNITGLSTTHAQDDEYIIGNFILVGSEGFIDEMAQLGYVEGENTTYMMISYENYTQDMPSEEWQAEYQRQVQAMVDAGVDLFVTNTDTDAVNLKALVGDIPIVFARADDPIATTAVADLVTPGGSMTGIMTNRPHERRLQLLTEIKPETDKIYYLYTPVSLEAGVVLQQVQTLAEELGVEVVVGTMDGTKPETLPAVIEDMPEGTDWVFMTPYSYVYFYDPELTAKLLEKSIELHAGIAGVTDLPTQGYTMGYGPNIDATGRQAAHIIDRILRGASPADLPVETAENYLLINLEMAETTGIAISEGILRQANTIIRPGYFESLLTPTPAS